MESAFFLLRGRVGRILRNMLPHKVVIVGAGFGGVYVARELLGLARAGSIDLTIVNRSNYFLFTPLLHEVATGGLGPLSITEPLREIFEGDPVHIVRGVVRAIKAGEKVIDLEDGTILSYDTLVVSTGAGTDLRSVPGAVSYALPLKTLIDAWRIRERIISAFEDAANIDDAVKRAQMLSFAVVGGGPTGVELVAEVQDFVRAIVRRYHRRATSGPLVPTVHLVHAGTELLAQFSPSLRRSAEQRLRDEGVVVHLDSVVASLSKEGVQLTNGLAIEAGLVVWAAGVTAIPPTFEGGVIPTFVQGRVIVDSALRVFKDGSIYAMGDAAYATNGSGVPYPMLAQVAVAQAGFVARNIRAQLVERPVEVFSYNSKGTLVSLGQWYAVGEIFSSSLRGRMAWWIWRTVYLFKFLSWRKRIRVAFEWTMHLFYTRDITGIDRE